VNIAAFLTKTATTFPDRPALTVGARVVHDYRSFAELATRLAGALRNTLQLVPGDRVALAMTNCPEFMLAKYACWHAGICAVPMNAKLHRREFAYILEQSGTKLAFTNKDLAATVGGLDEEIAGLERIIAIEDADWARLLAAEPLPLADVSPDDPAWLFYTSGTTGRPKGATLTHRNLTAMTMNYFADVDAIAPSDCVVHAAPMSHGSGCYGLPHVARAANQVVPESGRYDPAETLDLIKRHTGATFFFAPTMIVRLLAYPGLGDADTRNLKTIVYGGGPMYVADLLRGIEVLGQKFVQIYGQGEAPMTITGLSRAAHADTGHPRYLERLASVGTARLDVEVKVFDGDDRPLPPGEIGEVVVRGDVIMKGYWDNPEASAKALAHGWLHTGDMGAFDEDGFLTLKDRSKDMIISGGTNIYPREIEEVLLTHADVLEASVVGAPHPDWGEEVVAFIVRRPGSTIAEAELDRLCLDNIARFKRPKRYRFVDALPKNNYGKVLKTELRAALEKEAAEGTQAEGTKADAV
jgi:long-chain acyl-CoA synthetase